MNPLRTEAIKNFLIAKTHADLAELYNANMEVQVNVARDGGEEVISTYKGKDSRAWTDGIQTWKLIRIPYNAATNAEYTDVPMSFDLVKHAEGVGMTGWDWRNRVSKFVGFDFDAITGHSERHTKKLTEEELLELEERIKIVDWVTLRLSTSGKGRHLYVYVPDVETQNHTEHAALARAILGMLSGVTGYDFATKVDACGHILWQWHRKQLGTDGLKLLKQGTILQDIPRNWKDHIPVVSGRSKRTLPEFINEDSVDEFDELSSQYAIVKLDKHHLKLMDYLREKEYYAIWDADRRMLITHTYSLAEAHKDLGLKGPFSTLAEGSEAPNDANAFAFPTPNGGWTVRRYTLGVEESDLWMQDAKGYTKCSLNKEPDFDTACRAMGGCLNQKGAYVFNEAEIALEAAKMLGVSLTVAKPVLSRRCVLSKGKNGRLIIEIEHNPLDSPNEMRGWQVEKKNWLKVANANFINEPTQTQNFDNTIRHLVKGGKSYSWVIKTDEGKWVDEPLENVRTLILSMGHSSHEMATILGNAVRKPWELVNRPFEGEYLEGRLWNRDAAQLAFVPNLSDDRSYPTWQKVLNHIGSGLDEGIKSNKWAKDNGIHNGADYLKCWIANLIRNPSEQLPYIFLYSREQSTGKTFFHQAIKILFTRGYGLAKLALTSVQQFNAEIENLILCVVEEEDCSARAAQTYNRIKDWITAKDILIHPKGKTPITVNNISHWIQTANNPAFCPIFPNDRRITMVCVPDLDPEVKIPRTKMLDTLRKEAPDFLGELMSIELPTFGDRLAMEPIDTEEKEIAQEANMTPLELFVKENCYSVPGHTIPMSEFKARFHAVIPKNEWADWSPIRIGRQLPVPYQKGNNPRDNNQIHIINIAWINGEQLTPRTKLIIQDKRIHWEGE